MTIVMFMNDFYEQIKTTKLSGINTGIFYVFYTVKFLEGLRTDMMSIFALSTGMYKLFCVISEYIN